MNKTLTFCLILLTFPLLGRADYNPVAPYSVSGNNTATATAPALSLQQLLLGTPTYADGNNPYYAGRITVPSATQGNLYTLFSLQGRNAGAAASTEFLADADNATASTHYVVFGTNSSGYAAGGTATYPFGANNTFLISGSDPLFVGTAGSQGLTLFTNNSPVLALASYGNTSSAAMAALTLGTNNASGNNAANVGLSISDTTNQTSTANFTDLLVNRTQTAAGSGTQNLLDLQVGGTSVARVSNSGAITVQGTNSATRGLTIYNTSQAGNSATLLDNSGNGQLTLTNINNPGSLTLNSELLQFGGGSYIQDTFANGNLVIQPGSGGPGTMTINGVTIPAATDTAALLGTAQTFSNTNSYSAVTPLILKSTATNGLRVFNTSDQTNYELGSILWNTNNFSIGTTYAGTDTNYRSCNVGSYGGTFGTGATLSVNRTGGSTPFFDMQMTGTNATASSTYLRIAGGSSAAFTQSSGSNYILSLVPTLNETSTAATTVLLVNPTNTVLGTGAQYLAQFQGGGAGVLNIGNTTYGALPSGAFAAGVAVTLPAQTYTLTGTNTATTGAGFYQGATTFTNASAGTITDCFDAIFAGPSVAAGSMTITRAHTLGVLDSTAASASTIGAVVIANTFGTAATSVSIGGGNIAAGGTILGASASSRIGYATGRSSGGTVTQITSRTTGVTLNTPTGQITLFTAAGSATPSTFTVTNSSVAAVDTILVNEQSGSNLYEFFVTAVGAGSFNITDFTTGGTASDAPVINFTVIKGSSN